MLLLLVLLVLPFVAFVILVRTRSRIEKLEGLAGNLNVMVERLARRLSDLEHELRILRE